MRSPPCISLLGALASQLIVGRVPEQTTFSSIMVVQSFLGAVVQLLGVGAGGTLFLTSSPLIPALVLNAVLKVPGDDISLWSYAIGQITPLVTGSTLLYSVVDVFVPLVRGSVRLSIIELRLNPVSDLHRPDASAKRPLRSSSSQPSSVSPARTSFP